MRYHFANRFGDYPDGIECGLVTILQISKDQQNSVPVPLISVHVDAEVIHSVAQVIVTQEFINREKNPIEAIYYFPIDSNGAVVDFQAQVEDRKIQGVVKRTEEAKEEYEQAVKEHKTAFLAEENKPDVFKAKVGYLRPGVSAKIQISYVTEVKNEPGTNTIRFFIPTTIAPRYIPVESSKYVDKKDEEVSKDLNNMTFSESSPAPLSINVGIWVQGEFCEVKCPTHGIKTISQDSTTSRKRKGWSNTIIELLAKTTDMDRDFVILIYPEEDETKMIQPVIYKEDSSMSFQIPGEENDKEKENENKKSKRRCCGGGSGDTKKNPKSNSNTDSSSNSKPMDKLKGNSVAPVNKSSSSSMPLKVTGNSKEVYETTALMLQIIPSFKLNDQKTELVFVLDRSGSMSGPSIELAKKALKLFLHSLPSDCYFNIVGFGTGFQLFMPKSVKYEETSFREALSNCKSIDADLGGTEILAPLEAIYKVPPIPSYFRQIFVLTDGEVGNTDAVIALVRKHAHESRLFSLGIGDGASHYLVQGLAEAGNGTSAFVTYNEAVDKVVIQQLKNALQPSLTKVKIDWLGANGAPLNSGTLHQNHPLSKSSVSVSSSKDSKKHEPPPDVEIMEINKEKTLMGYGKPKEDPNAKKKKKSISRRKSSFKSHHLQLIFRQSPQKIPPIFDGAQLLIFGVFKSNETPSAAKITAKTPTGLPLTVEIKVSSDNDVFSGYKILHKLAAIKIIRELQSEYETRPEFGPDLDEADEEDAEEEELPANLQKQGKGKTKPKSKPKPKPKKKEKKTPKQVLKDEIIAISLSQGISSKFTAFVAVDEGSLPKKGGKDEENWVMESRNVPTQKPHGYGQSHSHSHFGLRRRLKSSRSVHPRTNGFSNIESLRSNDRMSIFQNKIFSETKYSSKTSTSKDVLDEVLTFQSFNGSFIWKPDLIKTIHLDFNTMKQEADKQKWDHSAWATALAIAFFTEKLGSKKERWELLIDKAKKWLQTNFPAQVIAMTAAATKFIKSS